MNKSLTQALGFCAALLITVTGCKKDEVRATVTPTSTPTLATSTNTVVLAQANSTQAAVVYNWTPLAFTWTNAENSYNPPVIYTLQVDTVGDNFASPISIDAGSGPNTTINVGDLDAKLITLKHSTVGKSNSLQVRLFASYAGNEPLYSNAVPLTATTYAYCAQPDAQHGWTIIGTVGSGVDWSTDYTMVYDCSANTYTYTGPLKAGVYKFRYGQAWTANLGGTSSTGGPLTQNGANLTIATAGTYTIVLIPGPLASDGTASGGSFTIK